MPRYAREKSKSGIYQTISALLGQDPKEMKDLAAGTLAEFDKDHFNFHSLPEPLRPRQV